MSISIDEVAKRAGVSIATVSRVINNTSRVSPDTAAKVREAVEALRYVPNRIAKALVSGRSLTLGIIVSDITNPFFPEIIQGFEYVAIQHGYEIITVSSNYEAQRMEQCVHRLLQRSVDGVAIMTSEFDPAIMAELTTLRVPTVFLDVGVAGPFVSNVRVDYASGIEAGVRHLTELGHRSIGFISGPDRYKSSRIRKDAFLHGLAQAGVAADSGMIVQGDHTIDGGLISMEKLMPKRPTAVLASNDLTAIGALRAIRRAGLSVPRDISVVGFDDIGMSRFTDPPLTTIRLDRAEIAAAAFRALLEGQKVQEDVTGIEVSVNTSLTVRESTGPVHHP